MTWYRKSAISKTKFFLLYLVACILLLSIYCDLGQLPKIPSFRKLNTILLRDARCVNQELFHSKPRSCSQLSHRWAVIWASFDSHRNLSKTFSAPCFSTSVTETTPDSDEVPSTSPKCFHPVLFDDTRTGVKLRKRVNWSQQWQRIRHHAASKNKNVNALEQKKGEGEEVFLFPILPVLEHWFLAWISDIMELPPSFYLFCLC